MSDFDDAIHAFETVKNAFQPMMDPAMAGGMPMDPAMMGQGGMPMDPAMMGQGDMPMDPAMMGQGGMPMDPAMMGQGGMPMDPAMMGQGGMPEGGGIEEIISELVTSMESMAQAIEQTQKEYSDTAQDVDNLKQQFTEVQTKLDMIMKAFGDANPMAGAGQPAAGPWG